MLALAIVCVVATVAAAVVWWFIVSFGTGDD